MTPSRAAALKEKETVMPTPTVLTTSSVVWTTAFLDTMQLSAMVLTILTTAVCHRRISSVLALAACVPVKWFG